MQKYTSGCSVQCTDTLKIKKGARTAVGVVCVLFFCFVFDRCCVVVRDSEKKYPLRVSQEPVFISALKPSIKREFHGIDAVSPNLELNPLFLVLMAVLPQHAYAFLCHSSVRTLSHPETNQTWR